MFLTKVKAARDAYEFLSPASKVLVTAPTLNILAQKEKSLVYSSVALKAALDISSGVNYIVLAQDFTLQEYVAVQKEVIIEGNSKTLTLADESALYEPTSNSAFVVKNVASAVKISDLSINMTVAHNAAWSSPMYIGLQLINSSNVTLNNMSLKGGHVGLYVNASTITANIIKTDANTLGGIGITGVSTFNNNGINTHSDASGKPAVWLENTTPITITGYTAQLAGTTYDGITVPAGQTFYKQ